MESKERFQFTFSGQIDLPVNAIWPVGYEKERPENPTAEDVVAWIRDQYGPAGLTRWMREWNMDCGASVNGVEIYPAPTQPIPESVERSQ